MVNIIILLDQITQSRGQQQVIRIGLSITIGTVGSKFGESGEQISAKEKGFNQDLIKLKYFSINEWIK